MGANGSSNRAPKWMGNAALVLLAVAVAALCALAFRSPAPSAAPVPASPISASTETAEQAPLKVAFLGDSYTEGARASSPAKRWTTVLSKAEGWREVNFGFGGTNYGTRGALDGGTTYAERVRKVVADRPDVVIVSGGRNTLGADQRAGIEQTFTRLRAGLPDAKIVALSPFWDSTTPPTRLAMVSDQVKAGVESVGGTFLDVGQPLRGHPELISDDGVHPNDAGYAALAAAVEEALQASPSAVKL